MLELLVLSKLSDALHFSGQRWGFFYNPFGEVQLFIKLKMIDVSNLFEISFLNLVLFHSFYCLSCSIVMKRHQKRKLFLAISVYFFSCIL